MKIDRNSTKGVGSVYGAAPARPSATPITGPVSAGPSQVDQVTVSEKAIRAAGVMEQLAAAPEVRDRLIAQIREQIAAGSYKVDARKLADRMLRARVLDE